MNYWIGIALLIAIVACTGVLIAGFMSYHRTFRAIERQQADDFAKVNKVITEAFNNADIAGVVDRWLEMMPTLYAAEREENKVRTEAECFKRTTAPSPEITVEYVQRVMNRIYGDGSGQDPDVRQPVIGGMGEVTTPLPSWQPNFENFSNKDFDEFVKSYIESFKYPATLLGDVAITHVPNYNMHTPNNDKCVCSTCVKKRATFTPTTAAHDDDECGCDNCTVVDEVEPDEDEECDLDMDCGCSSCTAARAQNEWPPFRTAHEGN